MSIFIAVEGPDSSLVAVHLKLLAEHMDARALPYRIVRDPGTTEVAEQIRSVMEEQPPEGLPVITRAFLAAAARAHLVQTLVRPALAAGTVVIAGGYVDGSMVREGFAGGMPLEFLSYINEMATGALRPHRTIVVDVPAGGDWFSEQVREGFGELVKAEPRRVKLVDGSGEVEVVQRRIRALVDEVLPRPRPQG